MCAGGEAVGLTARQKAFIEAYQGNATEATLKAGYSEKTAGKIGHQLLEKTRISQAIQEREEKRRNELIMSREERMIALSAIGRNAEELTKERIKAIDVLNKMSGDYLERIETAQTGAEVFKWQE